MLETAIGDGAEKLWFQQEISKAGRMDADITTLFVSTSRDTQIAFLGGAVSCWCCSCGIIGGNLLVGVVDEIFFSRHDGFLEYVGQRDVAESREM